MSRRNPGQVKGPKHKTGITGASLVARRKKLGLFQKEVAKMCNISQAFMSHLERKGSKTIGWQAAKKLVPFFASDLRKKKTTKKKAVKKASKKAAKKKVVRRRITKTKNKKKRAVRRKKNSAA